MALDVVEGKGVTVRAKRNGGFLPFACADSFRLNYKTELIKKTSVGQGRAAKYKPRGTDATIELTGLTTILPQSAMWTVFEILEKSIRGDVLEIEIEFLDQSGNDKKLTSFVLASSVDIAGGSTGFSQDNIFFQCTGAPGIFDNTVPNETNNNIVIPGYYEGQNGETGWTDTDTMGKEILLVLRGDALKIISTGTPNVQQVKHNSNTGEFFVSVPIAPQEPIFYLYQ